MEPFTSHTGLVVPLDRDNIDTDQIIPKQFLKRIERTGFGQFLFNDWRYLPDGAPDPTFELNQPGYEEASILVAGRNFGCGSSREHAVWALHDFGIRAIIAPSFADIFHNNALGNGLLPIALPEETVEAILRRARARQRYALTVNLQRSDIRDNYGFVTPFEIDPFDRHRLLEGLDDIGLTLRHADAIGAYEARTAEAREEVLEPAGWNLAGKSISGRLLTPSS